MTWWDRMPISCPLLTITPVNKLPNFVQDFHYLNSFVGWTGGDTGMLGLMTNVVGVTLCGWTRAMAARRSLDYAKMAASYCQHRHEEGRGPQREQYERRTGQRGECVVSTSERMIFAQIVDLRVLPRTFDSPVNRYITTTTITPQPESGREPGPYDLDEIFKRTAIRWSRPRRN